MHNCISDTIFLPQTHVLCGDDDKFNAACKPTAAALAGGLRALAAALEATPSDLLLPASEVLATDFYKRWVVCVGAWNSSRSILCCVWPVEWVVHWLVGWVVGMRRVYW